MGAENGEIKNKQKKHKKHNNIQSSPLIMN